MKRKLYIGNQLAEHGGTPTSADLMPGLLCQEGLEVVVASSKRNIALRMLDMLWHVVRYSRSVDYVIIDTYSTKNFWYALACSLLCRLLGLRYIPVLHGGSLPHRLDRSPRLARAILAHSFCNVAPSRYLQVEVERRGYAVRLIPNTIPVGSYVCKRREPCQPRLLFVRAFSSVYNPQMALRVLKILLEVFPEAELCMVGPDRDGTLEKCKKLAADLGLADRVRFTGKLGKAEWHKLAEDYDVFINTTNKDNTPVSVMEAMALGLPVVSTNPGGVPYLIDDGRDGLLVPVDDAEAMAGMICELLGKPEKTVAMADCARRKVEGFDWAIVKDKWIALLTEYKAEA
jgi:glycosyltransferase involved in cell wall biosynthesis